MDLVELPYFRLAGKRIDVQRRAVHLQDEFFRQYLRAVFLDLNLAGHSAGHCRHLFRDLHGHCVAFEGCGIIKAVPVRLQAVY